VRRLIQGETDPDFCRRPAFVEGVRKLASHGLSFDLCVYHYQLPAVIELVRQVPEVSFVLDHIGKPNIAGGQREPWKTHIATLARLENVACKLSGVATEADWKNWTTADLRPYLDHVLAVFGCRRLMFGSDWPVSTLAIDYGRWLEIAQEATIGCSRDEQRELFWGTAERFYRL
jgi:L-fuconolactonase